MTIEPSLVAQNPGFPATLVRGVIGQLGRQETFACGETLLHSGATSASLLIIEEGEVEMVVGDATAAISAGGLIGEHGFLEGCEAATVVARTPTRVRRIARDELGDLLAEDPKRLYDVLDQLRRLQQARGAVSDGESADKYVAALAEEALLHRAVRHPYLQRLAGGDLPDLRWALTDFASQYYGYSRYFPRYLTTVMSRLDLPEHRNALLDNLTEESGSYEEDELLELDGLGIEREWFVGIPHPQLFRRFAEALGAKLDEVGESDQLVCWRELFLEILRNGSPAEAIGALGLGTENIVSTMYVPFVQAIRRLDIAPRDSVFFVLHTAIDDEHQEVLQRIAAAYAATEQGRIDLRRGMLKALQCRASFWDWLLERAQDPWRARSVL